MNDSINDNMMRRITSLIFVFIVSLSLWAGETGLFTYEGGFFVKDGNHWTEYRPKDKPGIRATYDQCGEEEHYYKIKNTSQLLAIPKSSNNKFYKSVNGEWRVVYTTRVIYSYFKDTSVKLFCFENGYYVRDKKKWRLYLPDKKQGLWTDFDQYDEDEKFFYLNNDFDKVCVPKRADLKCFLWNKNSKSWEANYSITEIYDHI